VVEVCSALGDVPLLALVPVELEVLEPALAEDESG
jgi:hypothetical protein